MTPETLLKRAEAQRAIRRAGRVARTAIAVHALSGDGESARVTGCGPCAAACAHVQKHPWGVHACKSSRALPAQQALNRARPVPFLCHMGFACVAAPVFPGSDSSLVFTFGPFVPAEAPDSLERDAWNGLAKVDPRQHKELPFTLSDIPSVPADVPGDVAQWLTETLMEQLRNTSSKTESTTMEAPISPSGPLRRFRAGAAVRDALGARAILAAISAASPAPLRKAVLEQLQPDAQRQPLPVLRARALALAGAIFEAAEHTGGVPDTARSRLVALPARLNEVQSLETACRAILRTIAPIRLAQRRSTHADHEFFVRLDRFISNRPDSEISLTGAARAFGLPPSTLTRRIQRRFGVTFTGYVARHRLARAKSMLQRTQLSVETIAKRTGFTDAAHLRKQLQRFEGKSPADFRAQSRQKKAAG